MKWITFSFALFLIVVIFLANMGMGAPLLSLCYALPGDDRAGHFILMGVMALLLNLAMRGARVELGRLRLMKGSLLLSAIIIVEELTQVIMPNRTFSLIDLGASLAGVLVFGRLALLLPRRDTEHEIGEQHGAADNALRNPQGANARNREEHAQWSIAQVHDTRQHQYLDGEKQAGVAGPGNGGDQQARREPTRPGPAHQRADRTTSEQKGQGNQGR